MALAESAWLSAYRRLQQPLYNVLYRWLWNRQDCEDLMHEAFLRVWDKRESVHEQGLDALIYQTALNLARNRLRWRELWQFVGFDGKTRVRVQFPKLHSDPDFGYADTLAQALVTEGLACCFESELPGGAVPMYATSVGGAELARLRARAQALFEQRLSGWGEWFFGEAEPEIPMHAGCALGYAIVSGWLARQGTTAATACQVPADVILAAA